MYRNIIVPLDGSARAARAIGVAGALSAQDGSEVVLASVVPSAFAAATADRLREQAAAAGVPEPSVELHVTTHWPAAELVRALRVDDGSLLCMTTTGRSHLGQVLGSVAEALLRGFTGPFLLLGPECVASTFVTGGPMLLAVDGSQLAGEIHPLAEAWSDTYGFEPEEVTVDPHDAHGQAHPSVAGMLVQRAETSGASLIAMTTHGRTGVGRLLMGSVAMETVRHAPCPVLVHRPRRLRT